MANLDLAAPSTAILRTRRFSCPFAGVPAQLQPVAEIIQCGEPINHWSQEDARLRGRPPFAPFRRAAAAFALDRRRPPRRPTAAAKSR